MKPEEYIKTIDNEEKPKETEAIKEEIFESIALEKKLRE